MLCVCDARRYIPSYGIITALKAFLALKYCAVVIQIIQKRTKSPAAENVMV